MVRIPLATIASFAGDEPARRTYRFKRFVHVVLAETHVRGDRVSGAGRVGTNGGI